MLSPKTYALLFCLIPCVCISQTNGQGNDHIVLQSNKTIITGTITIDSFAVITTEKKHPKFKQSIEILAKQLSYPPMEADNFISADIAAIFRVTTTGKVDSVWFNTKPTKGFDREIRNFFKNINPLTPAKKRCKNVTSVCQLFFHFKIQ